MAQAFGLSLREIIPANRCVVAGTVVTVVGPEVDGKILSVPLDTRVRECEHIASVAGIHLVVVASEEVDVTAIINESTTFTFKAFVVG